MGKIKIKIDGLAESRKIRHIKNITGVVVVFLYIYFFYNILHHNIDPFYNNIFNILLWLFIASIVFLIYPATLKIIHKYVKNHFVILDDNSIIFHLGLGHKKQFPVDTIDTITLEQSYIKVVRKDHLVFKVRFHLDYSAQKILKKHIDSFNQRNKLTETTTT